MKACISRAAVLGLLSSTVAAKLEPIVIKGTKFFGENTGKQFYMNGIAYQQDVAKITDAKPGQKYSDPLADSAACKRDIPYMVKAKTNTIRVYAIDPTLNHDDCMSQLDAAGIYVVMDLSQPGESINRDDAQWNVDLYKRYTSVVDAVAKYDNILGFFAGNEVSNQINNTIASAFVKAAVRDTKAYIKAKGYRAMGVGYATNDDKDIREEMASYFACGTAEESIDFWGYNVYSWCGDSNYEKSGYKTRTEEFSTYPVPVFFAEYGCNELRPAARLFTEVGAIYSTPMDDTWSGGIVYMFWEEDNKFGLVQLKNNQIVELDDYKNYVSEISKVSPSGVSMSSYNPSSVTRPQCPGLTANWRAVASPLPPSVNPDLCSCMVKSLKCVVADDVDPEEYGKLFGQVCGYAGSPCAGIGKNATLGEYGAYSMCSAKDQLSFAFNQYASKQSSFAQACNFGGKAKTQNAVTPTASACSSAMSEAGTAGTGTVNGGLQVPSSSSTNSKAAAAGVTVPALDLGIFRMGAYVAFAIFGGAAMILL